MAPAKWAYRKPEDQVTTEVDKRMTLQEDLYLVLGAYDGEKGTAVLELKVNPLVRWTEAQTWDYVRAHEVPYNELFDQGYTSIGCAPCTRPVLPGEPERAGRWWWEGETDKECGIHCSVQLLGSTDRRNGDNVREEAVS